MGPHKPPAATEAGDDGTAVLAATDAGEVSLVGVGHAGQLDWGMQGGWMGASALAEPCLPPRLHRTALPA